MSRRSRPLPAARQEFDSAAFARAIADAREHQHLSTRDLARLAGVSQAYVVALEQQRHTVGTAIRKGPTPTVDVVAGLAFALGLEPAELLAQSLRRVGRHVLLLVDTLDTSAVRHLRDAAGAEVERWVVAGAQLASVEQTRISLRRTHAPRYDPARISRSLDRELLRIAPFVSERSLGFVFAEMADAMTKLDDPSDVIAFESSWGSVVSSAVRKAGANAAWNVCVYPIETIRSLPDPRRAAVSLAQSHDMVLLVENNRLLSGAACTRRFGRLLGR
jgi:transcriptional regulator with XRE-family HTH domain